MNSAYERPGQSAGPADSATNHRGPLGALLVARLSVSSVLLASRRPSQLVISAAGLVGLLVAESASRSAFVGREVPLAACVGAMLTALTCLMSRDEHAV